MAYYSIKLKKDSYRTNNLAPIILIVGDGTSSYVLPGERIMIFVY